jgi:hypothetical protein
VDLRRKRAPAPVRRRSLKLLKSVILNWVPIGADWEQIKIEIQQQLKIFSQNFAGFRFGADTHADNQIQSPMTTLPQRSHGLNRSSSTQAL